MGIQNSWDHSVPPRESCDGTESVVKVVYLANEVEPDKQAIELLRARNPSDERLIASWKKRTCDQYLESLAVIAKL